MAKQIPDTWDPNFYTRSPIFFPITAAASVFAPINNRWPTLDEYQALLQQSSPPPTSLNGKPIFFVPQAHTVGQWIEDYEPRIYLKGEVQTRTENWHDFFQVLMWSTFPKTKATLNAKHYAAIQSRLSTNPLSKQRSPIENALTQFDECGAVVVSSEETLLQHIQQFQWYELFWLQRKKTITRLQCFVFGHATYEKALNPYIGLTAHAVLLLVEKEFFQWPLTQQLIHLDTTIADLFSKDRYQITRDFQPFPLLGMPGWDDNNSSDVYYKNTQYFRPGRKRLHT